MCGSLTPIAISLVPVLINRVVLSLKRTAYFNSTVNRVWSLRHFSNTRSEPVSTMATSETVVSQPPTELLLDTDDHNDIPLDDLTRERSR